MSQSENPCLSLAIARLNYRQSSGLPSQAERFAIWVLKAPYPSGYVHHDCAWPETLTQAWLAWQEAFSSRGLPHVPLVHHASSVRLPEPISLPAGNGAPTNYTSRLMQHLGIGLWQWLFDGPIHSSLAQSQGIAIGQNKPLRLRLEIRDPDLIALPWEILQPQAGKQAISLNQQLLFSRTTSDVDPLPRLRHDRALKILLVLGQNAETETTPRLQLEKEAAALVNILERSPEADSSQDTDLAMPSSVDVLLQTTPAELISRLETGKYNILFYAGHGIPAPDGGLLFLRPQSTLNGTELAQILVRCQVKLAVFNTCWGAQPEQQLYSQPGGSVFLSLPRSSLAEVLIHHGVPAVLGMRDSIADEEALCFIQTFAQALRSRLPIDRAVAVARQQLLSLYKFNQPAWTLPVLYMHPEFDGELAPPVEEGITELPGMTSGFAGTPVPLAHLRTGGISGRVWQLRGGVTRVGRQPDNDVVIPEQWVSQKHAEIICRDVAALAGKESVYFLRDFSRFGTMIFAPQASEWQKVHHQEVPLQSGFKLKFGSMQGQTIEFALENNAGQGS